MIDSKRWSKFSLFEQMGHIGSEISRACHWNQKEDLVSRDHCIERAFDLIDLTIADARWRGRLKEVCRFREVLADIYCRSHVYKVSLNELNKYCTDFALAVRRSC